MVYLTAWIIAWFYSMRVIYKYGCSAAWRNVSGCSLDIPHLDYVVSMVLKGVYEGRTDGMIIDGVNLCTGRTTCPVGTSSTINPTRTAQPSKPYLRCDKLQGGRNMQDARSRWQTWRYCQYRNVEARNWLWELGVGETVVLKCNSSECVLWTRIGDQQGDCQLLRRYSAL